MDKVQNNILHPHITPFTKNFKYSFHQSDWIMFNVQLQY